MPLALPAIVAALGILALFGRAGYFAGLLIRLAGGDWPGIYGLSGILVAHVFFNLPLATRLFLEALRHGADRPVAAGEPARHGRCAVLPADRMAGAARGLPGVAGLVFMLCVTSFTIVLTLGGGPAATTLEVGDLPGAALRFRSGACGGADLLQIALTIAVDAGCCRGSAPMPARDANLPVRAAPLRLGRPGRDARSTSR